MLKNVILLALFLVLGGTAYWLVTKNKPIEDTFAANPLTQFAVQDINQIKRIFLTDRLGNQALVERVSDLNWIYTNKVTGMQYRANPNIVYTLLQTLQRVRVRQAVSKAGEANAVKALASQGIKVEVYDQNDTKIRVFNVGAMTDGATGNFINMDGSEKIYVAYIPNNPGTIDTRFVTQEQNWRDKAVLRNEVNAIEFVEMQYHAPSQKPFSFRVDRLGGEQVSVKPLDGSSPKYTQEQVNQSNALTYLESYDVVSAERILYNKRLRDSIILQPAFATLRYKASYHNEPQEVRIYSLYNPNADRGDGEVGHRQKIQRYFIDIDKDNFFLAQHIVLRDLFWSYDYFFQQGAVELLEDEAQVKEAFQETEK